MNAPNDRTSESAVRRSRRVVVLGAVLAGGASRRMGTDKALVPVDGEPLAARVAVVLSAAGATSVVLVGASDQAVRAVGLANLPDEDPGSGPLGGLAAALSWVAAENERTGSPGHGSAVRHGAEGSDAVDPLAILLVAACDQPDLDAVALRLLIDALASEDRAMAAAACFSTDDGRRHPLPSAWRLDLTAGPVGRLHAGGERRIGAAFDAVATVELPTGGDELIDLDTPSDVALWQERHRPLG